MKTNLFVGFAVLNQLVQCKLHLQSPPIIAGIKNIANPTSLSSFNISVYMLRLYYLILIILSLAFD